MSVQEATSPTGRREETHRGAAKFASTDERLLVGQAKSGRSSAFGELYERHRLRIYHTALSRFREDSAFSTWVTRIAIEALMLLRQRLAPTPLSDSNNDHVQAPSALDLPDERPSPEQALVENELRAAVIHAISHLQENLRIVVLLRELQGLTSAETSRRLGLTVSGVKARSFRARRYLRQYLVREYKLRAATA